MTYVTPDDLAAIWRVPVAEVYRRAHRGRWRRTRTKPIGYLLADVMASGVSLDKDQQHRRE